MSQTDRCPECAAERVGGLCPRCLIRVGLDGPALSLGPDGATGATVDFGAGAGGAGVLDTLAASVGPVPRVLLRDTDTGPEPPIVRPTAAAGAPRYRIDGEIARGGMGAVLKGRDPDLGREVALKVLRDDLRDRPELVARFVEEAQIAGQLQHPGVVPVYELGALADRRPYFAMKLVKGRTLAALLDDRASPADGLPRLLGVFEQVAQTVAYAHARGVIHRDLKPSNVMVGGFGEVQVMDWGLAKVLSRGGVADDARAGKVGDRESVIATARSGGDSDVELSQAGSVLGTPSYMAPEQARGENDAVDERADVFALGSMLCEILTGEPAFVGRTSGEIQRKAARAETAEALARLDAGGADAELVALARDCLAAEPGDRPRDAGAVSGRLTGYLAGVQERLRAAELERARAEARAAEERKRRRLQAGLAAAVLALVGLGGAGAWVQARQRSERIAATTRLVDDALGKAADLRGRALAAPTGELAGWDEALAQARRAEDAIAQGAADDALRGRVAATRAELERLRAAAERRAREAAAERRLVARLARIREDWINIRDQAALRRDYFAAFREIGVDMETLSPEQAGTAIAGRPVAKEVVAALDALLTVPLDQATFGRFLGVARAADPDPWRNDLRALLGRPRGERVEALKRIAADRDALEQQSGPGLMLLWTMLKFVGEDDLAQEMARLAWLRAPDDFTTTWVLGMTSWKGRWPAVDLVRPTEALRYLSAAVALRPDSSGARINLANALLDSGDYAQAMAVHREMMRAHPGSKGNWFGLNGIACCQWESGDLAGAQRTIDKALGLYPANGTMLATRAEILLTRGRIAQAVADLERAVARFRERKSGDYAAFYGSLLPEARWLAEHAATLKALASPGARDGEEATSLELAARARAQGRPALAARLYAMVLAVSRARAGDLMAGHRYRAACAAALAGCGGGEDDPRPDDAERAGFRRRALEWLRADLAAWSGRLQVDRIAGPAAREALHRWREVPDLAGVRDAGALRSLPDAERKDWRDLWASVDRTLEQAGPR